MLISIVKKALIAAAIACALVWGIWISLPVSVVQTLMEEAAGDYGATLVVSGLRKGLFYRLYSDGITLRNEKGDIVALHSVEANIRPYYLVVSRMDVSFHGRVGAGFFSGRADLSRNKFRVNLTVEEAGFADMLFLSTAGITGTGTISGKIEIEDHRRRMTFLLRDADMHPALIAGSFLPLNFFKTVKGSLEADGPRINVESISLEGPNVSARLKGVIMDGMMDLQMEVMPEKAFLENPLFLTQISSYQVSPGYYVIPVKGPVVFRTL